MDTTLRQHQTIVQSIEKMLKARRMTFFKVYPNPAKQQQIIAAESNLWRIKKISDPTWQDELKKYGYEFIQPLIPTIVSRYYFKWKKLYDLTQDLTKQQ